MSKFGELAKQEARRYNYTEYEAEEMSMRRAQVVGDVISEELEEPYIDELCQLLDLDPSGANAVEITPTDVALAAWSNWGAGSFNRAMRHTSMDEGDFVVLNDYFDDIYEIGAE